MGQTNSVPLGRCSYHHLRTVHSEEGFCAECNRRFSSSRGRDLAKARRMKSKLNDKLGEKERELPLEKAFAITSDDGDSERGEYEEEYEEESENEYDHDDIHKCYHCPRFFRSSEELHNHLAPLKNVVDRRMSTRYIQERHFCVTCDRTYLCSSSEHSRAVHMHMHDETQGDSTTQKDDIEIRAFEIKHNCCVPCSIYFTSREKRNMHIQDVERHATLLRQAQAQRNHARSRPSTSSLSSGSTSSASPTTPSSSICMGTTPPSSSGPDTSTFSDSYPPGQTCVSSFADSPFAGVANDLDLDLRDFPKPPTTLGSPAHCGFQYTPKWMLKAPTASQRKPASAPGLSGLAEEEEFECPLCLDNEENVASLPCGHIFGVECILRTLAADERCPICRSPTSMRNVRRLFSLP